MSGTIAIGSAPGGASAGTTTRVSSWAFAPYASHHARWKAHDENGVAQGVCASERVPRFARDVVERTALGANGARRVIGGRGKGLGGPGTGGLGVEGGSGHPRNDSIEPRSMVATATGTFGSSRRWQEGAILRPTPRSAEVSVPILRRPETRLFLTATSLLFVELLLIRWIPANVIYVGFFRNFLLMASFLGIGVGILWGRDPKRIPISPFGPLLLALVVLVTQFRVTIQLGDPNEIFFGLSESRGADINFLVLPALVIIATVIMAGLAVPLGRLLTSMPPLKAYSDRHPRLDDGRRAVHAPVRDGYAADRVVRRRGRARIAHGPGNRARTTIDRHGGVPGRRHAHPVRQRAAEPDVVALLPDRPVFRRRDPGDRRQRHPAPGDVADRSGDSTRSTSRCTAGSRSGRTTGS